MWAILASGESLKPEHVELVRQARSDGRINGFIAVSNVAIDFAPDADALVSHDASWYKKTPEHKKLEIPKYCRQQCHGTKQFIPRVQSGCNSGLMAMEVAARIYKAKKLMLLGFDMHGTHYFGKHKDGLKNTTESRFRQFLIQFSAFDLCPVVNCNPDSALKKFPFMSIEDAIKWGNET